MVSVLPAADGLEQCIMDVISTCDEDIADVHRREKLTPYQVRTWFSVCYGWIESLYWLFYFFESLYYYYFEIFSL